MDMVVSWGIYEENADCRARNTLSRYCLPIRHSLMIMHNVVKTMSVPLSTEH